MPHVKYAKARKWAIFASLFRQPVGQRAASVVLSDRVGDIVARDMRGAA